MSSKAVARLKRSRKVGKYIVANNATIRQAAEKFGISTSQVSCDINEWLRYDNRELYNKVKQVLSDRRTKR